MSIKETEVEVVLHGKNIKHFENKDYIIQRYFHKRSKKWRVKRGTKIWVKVSDLPSNSNTPVTAICENPNCPNPERIVRFDAYRDICHDCYNHSEENSLRHTGENNPMFGKESNKKGKTYEELYGIEKANQLKEKISGENSPNRNPNLTDEEREFDRSLDPEYKEWSYKIKERDNFKCVIPGCNNHDLESHHLDNWNDFPDSRYDIDNGVTLCEEHHTSANGYSFHTLYGIKGNVKEQFIEWIEMFKEEND